MVKQLKRGRKAARNAPPPLVKGGFTPESIVDKIDLTETCKQILYRVRWPDTWESEENVLDTYALECFLNNIDVTENRLCTVEAEDDEELWDAHQIIKRKIVNKKIKYLVKWKDTWLWDTQLSDRQDLIRQFEDSATSLNIVPAHRSNENNENIKENPPQRKRRRLAEKHENATEIPNTRQQKSQKSRYRFPKTLEKSTENYARIIIEDDKIDAILGIGKFFSDRLKGYLIRRTNGECGIVPFKVAHIKYPDAVMDFYESHFEN